MNRPLLEIEGLTKFFPIRTGLMRKTTGHVKAVNDVSFSINRGETLGLVGESGCGKTTIGRLILRLIEPTSGSIRFNRNENGIDLLGLHGEALRVFRKHIQLIFQDPFSSLNPRMTVRDILSEPLRALNGGSRREVADRVNWLIRSVGLQPTVLVRYPHAFSGGQRQRIGIARALAVNPELIVCDEAVSALDVSVQAQIINLLKDLQKEFGLTYLFIAHDLSVVENISTRVAVMYAGRLVETAATRNLFQHPRHPYTEALMNSVPKIDPSFKGKRAVLPGEVADASDLPPGCAFHPRCRYCTDLCKKATPELRSLSDDRLVACHRAEEIELEGVSPASTSPVRTFHNSPGQSER